MLITNLIKRTKNKNMVISIHAEKKKVRKNSTPSMRLTLKTRNIRELPQLDNENLQKPTVHIVDTAAKLLQSCPTLRPHRWQPTRLPHPWDSPGKNTSGLPFPSPMHESEE